MSYDRDLRATVIWYAFMPRINSRQLLTCQPVRGAEDCVLAQEVCRRLKGMWFHRVGLFVINFQILNYCFHVLNSKYRESKDETATYKPARLFNVSSLIRWSCAWHEKLRH